MIEYVTPDDVGADLDICDSVARICNKIANETWYDGYNNAVLDVLDIINDALDMGDELEQVKETIKTKLMENDV